MSKKSAFISYAHDDYQIANVFINEIKTHLNDVNIDIWYDEQITLGTKWHQEIQKNIKNNDIAILLISSNFLNSDYIRKNEYKKLLLEEKQRGLNIVPILLSHCNFDKYEDLKERQIFMPKMIQYTSINKTENLCFQDLLDFDNNSNPKPNSNRTKYLLDFVVKLENIKVENTTIEVESSDLIDIKERSIEKIIESLVEKKDWSIKKKFDRVSIWEDKIIYELYLISQGDFGDDCYFMYFHESSTQKKTYDHLTQNKLFNKKLKLYILTEQPNEKSVLNSVKRLENIKNTFNTDDVYFIEDFAYKYLYKDYFDAEFFSYEKFDINNFVESFSIEHNDDKTAFQLLEEWYREKSNPIIVIEGYGGVGKSTLAKYFLDSIEEKNIAKLFIESKDIISEIVKLSEENEEIDDIFYFYEAATNKKDIQKKLTQKLFEISIDNGNLLIVLDGIDEIIARLGKKFNISNFLNSIFDNYSNNNEKCKIIITCRDYFWDKLNITLQNIHLKAFNEELAREYFTKSFAKLTTQINKGMRLANKFTIKSQDGEDIYIPYILDTIVYIMNKKLLTEEDDEFEDLELDSNYLNPSIANDYLIGSICDREIHKLGNMNNIDKQINFFIKMSINYNGSIKVNDLLNENKGLSSIIENLKSHTILNTDNEKIFFRYDFFNEYFRGLYIANYFKEKPNEIDERLFDTLVKYINYDTTLLENILDRISFDDDLKLYCLEKIEEINNLDCKTIIKRQRISSIFIFLLVLLKQSKKIDNINCTELLESLFGCDKEIKNLSIIDLYTNDKVKPIFNFKDKELINCYFENYEYFWECNISDDTKFKECIFKSLKPNKDISINVNPEQFIDCNIIEIEDLIKKSKKEQKEKRRSLREDLELLFKQFYKNGNFYPQKQDRFKQKHLIRYIKILLNKNIIEEYINESKPKIGKQYKVNSKYNDITKKFSQGNNSLSFDNVVLIVEKEI